MLIRTRMIVGNAVHGPQRLHSSANYAIANRERHNGVRSEEEMPPFARI